ncbi:MAG: spore coat protein [Actinobacteria bacterium]|nr:spore coat protein [Actinomycetota bacterium]
MNLSDRDILTDLLIDKKYISTGYHQALLESADNRVRNTLMQIHDDELASHRTVFDIMNSRGYYRVQPATPASAMYQAGMQAQQPGQGMGAMAGTAMGAASPGQGIGMAHPGMHPYQYGTGQQPGQQPYGQDPGRNW